MMPSIIIRFMVIIAVVAVIPINLTAFTLAEYAWSFGLPKVYTWLALRWKNRFKNSFQGRESQSMLYPSSLQLLSFLSSTHSIDRAHLALQPNGAAMPLVCVAPRGRTLGPAPFLQNLTSDALHDTRPSILLHKLIACFL